MRHVLRRLAALAIAVAVVAPQAGAATGMHHHPGMAAANQPPPRAIFTPPTPIFVKEPLRAKPTRLAPSSIRPKIVQAVRPGPGVRANGPKMLRPTELEPFIAAARKAALLAKSNTGRSAVVTTKSAAGTRHALSLPSSSNASGTGLQPYWRYQEESLPGAMALVNVGTGNLLVQDDDMNVPHKGVAMAFRRAYNSQSLHNVNASDASEFIWKPANMYGNGWTNTFDAHLARTSGTLYSVFDVDGTRYDYDYSVTANVYVPRAGIHATLAFDGDCGFAWTKQSGTTYYFYRPNPAAPCTRTGTVGGYGGRLYQIIGRNRNTYITLSYSWDNNDYSASGKITAISAQSESGLTARLSFADVGGHRLLQQLTYPDGTTTISYGYDAQGNLTSVTQPANNSTGTQPQKWFGYGLVGSDSVISWAASPRWAAQCNLDNCGGDGAYTAFGYVGSAAPTAAVASFQNYAVVNPTMNDGFAAYGPLQQGYPTYGYAFHTEYYTTGVATPTLRDTDGHIVNWVVDGSGRPTQTQVCTITPSQGSPCPSANMLVTNEVWDASNNRTAIINPRGAQTDMAYDVSGNVVAIAEPPQYQGYARPTTLIDYDNFNNVVAICDPVFVHSAAADWTGQYTNGDSYCTGRFGTTGHPYAQFSYTATGTNGQLIEPNGELTSVTTATGYTTQISYDAASQGGQDFGLPTKSVGASMFQFDNSLRQPTSTASYDANGNVVCSQSDAGTGTPSTPATTVLTYDPLGRLVASADPDDASLFGSCSGKVAGIGNSAIVTRQTYYADGSLATSQTPSEAAANYGTVYSYDLDGNQISDAPYNGTPQSPQTARTKSWFDGMDRLIETQQPPDPSTPGDLPISLRYLFDLSQSGASRAATTLNGVTVSAHGNLFDTVKNTPTGWADFTYAAFDAADRKITDYAFAPCPAQTGASGPIYCSQPAFATRYDWDASSLNPNHPALGLLVATLDGAGASRQLTYSGHEKLDSVTYSGDGGVTNPVSYAYDFDDRITDGFAFPTSGSNHVAYSYTSDGNVSQIQNSFLNTTIGYNYYPDGQLSTVSTSSTRFTTGDLGNYPTLYRYAYRNDGLPIDHAFGAAASQTASWTYTLGGRMQTMTDPAGNPSETAQYNDGRGRLSSYTMPAGAYGSFTYDSQGRLGSFSDPYAAETIANQYNIRGDLVGRTYQPSTGTKPGFQYRNLQGVLVQRTTDQWDGRTGAPLILANGPAAVYDTVGRLSGGVASLSYDAESRLINGDTTPAARANDPTCSGGGSPTTASSPERNFVYNALGQLVTSTVGPANTPTQHAYFWDRSALLETLTSDSTVMTGWTTSYAADGLGSIDDFAGLSVTDKDFDGAIAGYHNALGHSSWGANNPYRQWCVGFTDSLPPTQGYQGPTNSSIVGDGSSDVGRRTSSYGRTYLSAGSGYTTPNYRSSTPYASSRAQSGTLRQDDSCPSGLRDSETGKCQPLPSIGQTKNIAPPQGIFPGIQPFLAFGPDIKMGLVRGTAPAQRSKPTPNKALPQACNLGPGAFYAAVAALTAVRSPDVAVAAETSAGMYFTSGPEYAPMQPPTATQVQYVAGGTAATLSGSGGVMLIKNVNPVVRGTTAIVASIAAGVTLLATAQNQNCK